MPRYYFNIDDRKVPWDRDGTELRDEAHAKSEAVALAGQSISDIGGEFWIGGGAARGERSHREGSFHPLLHSVVRGRTSRKAPSPSGERNRGLEMKTGSSSNGAPRTWFRAPPVPDQPDQ